MPSSREPENEFEFYLKFAKPLVLNLPDASQRVNAAAWIQKLRRESAGDEKLRTDYLKILLFVLQKRRLIAPFTKSPNQDEKLEPFPEQYKLMSEMVKYLTQDQQIGDGAENLLPPCLVEYSHDLKEYAVSQEIPKFGIHAYFAISFKQTLQHWHGAENKFFPEGTVNIGEPHSLWNVPSSAIMTDSASVRALSLSGKKSSKKWPSRTNTPKTSSPEQSISSRRSSQMDDVNKGPKEVTGVTFSPSVQTGAIPSLMSPKTKDPNAVSFEWMEGMSGTYVTDLRAKYGEQSSVKCKAEKEDRQRPTWGSNLINLSPLARAEASAAIVPASTPSKSDSQQSQLKITSGTPKVTFKETKTSVSPPTPNRNFFDELRSKSKFSRRAFDEAQDFVWMSQKFQPEDDDNIFDTSAPFSDVTDLSTSSSRRSSSRSRDSTFQEGFEWLDDPSIAKYAGGPGTRFPDAERLPDEYWHGESRRRIPPFTARDGRGRRSFIKDWRQAARRHDIPPTPPPFSRDPRIRSRARVYQPEEFGLGAMSEKEWQSGPRFFAEKTEFFPGEDERLAKRRKRFSQIGRSLDEELFDFDEEAPSFLDSSTVASDFGAPSPPPVSKTPSVRYATDTLPSPVRRAIEYREKMRMENAQSKIVSPPRTPAILDEEISMELASPIRPRREVKRYVEYRSPRALHSETNVKEELPGGVKLNKSIIEDVYDTDESLQILDSSRLSAISEPFGMPDLPGPFDFQENVQTPPKFKPFRYGEPTDIENLSFSSTKSYINDMTCPEFSSILSSSSSIGTLSQNKFSDTMLSPPPFMPFDYESPEGSITDRLIGDITPPQFEAFDYEESDEYIDDFEMPQEFSAITKFDRRPDSPRPTDQTIRRVRYQNQLSPIKDVISTPPRLGAQMQYFPGVPESAKLVKSGRIMSDTHPTMEQYISPRLQLRDEMYTPSRGAVRRRVKRRIDLDQWDPDVSPTTKTGDISRRRSTRVVRRINFDQPEPTPATPDVLSTTPPPIVSSAMPWGNEPIAFGLPSPIKPLPRIPNRQFVSPLRSPRPQMRRTESKKIEKLPDGRIMETSIKSIENISDESLGIIDPDDMSDIEMFSSTKRKIGEYTPPKYSPLAYESFEGISDDSLGIIESDFSDLSTASERRIGEFTPPKFTPFMYESPQQIANEISENLTPPSFTPFSYFGDEEEDDIFMTSMSPQRVPMFDRRPDSPRPTDQTIRRVRYHNQLSPIKDVISTPPRLGAQMQYFPGVPESAKLVKSGRIMSDTHPTMEQYISPRLQLRDEMYTPSRGAVRRRVKRRIDLDQWDPDVSPTTKTGDISRRRSTRVVRRINFDQPEPTPSTPDILSTTPPPIVSSAMPWGNEPIAFGLPSPIKPLPRIPNRQFVSPLRSPRAQKLRTESKQIEKLPDGRIMETSIKSIENISDESLGIIDPDDMSDIEMFSSTKRKIGEYTPPKYSPLAYESFEGISDDSLGIIESDFSDLSTASERRIGEFTPPKFTPFMYESPQHIANEISENLTPPSFTPFSYIEEEEDVDDMFQTSMSVLTAPMLDRRADSPRPTGPTLRKRLHYEKVLSPIKDILQVTEPRLHGTPESANKILPPICRSYQSPVVELYKTPPKPPSDPFSTPKRTPATEFRNARKGRRIDFNILEPKPTRKLPSPKIKRKVTYKTVTGPGTVERTVTKESTSQAIAAEPLPSTSRASPRASMLIDSLDAELDSKEDLLTVAQIPPGLQTPLKPLPRPIKFKRIELDLPKRTTGVEPEPQQVKVSPKRKKELWEKTAAEILHEISNGSSLGDFTLDLLEASTLSEIGADLGVISSPSLGSFEGYNETPPKYEPYSITEEFIENIQPPEFSSFESSDSLPIGEYTPPHFSPHKYIRSPSSPPSFTPFGYEDPDEMMFSLISNDDLERVPMLDRRADSPRPAGRTVRRRSKYKPTLSPVRDILRTPPKLGGPPLLPGGTPESARKIRSERIFREDTSLIRETPRRTPSPYRNLTPKRESSPKSRRLKQSTVRRKLNLDIPDKDVPQKRPRKAPKFKLMTPVHEMEEQMFTRTSERTPPRLEISHLSEALTPPSYGYVPWGDEMPRGLPSPIAPSRGPVRQFVSPLRSPRHESTRKKIKDKTPKLHHSSPVTSKRTKHGIDISQNVSQILRDISHDSDLDESLQILDLSDTSFLDDLSGPEGSIPDLSGYDVTPPAFNPFDMGPQFDYIRYEHDGTNIEKETPPHFSSYYDSESSSSDITSLRYSPIPYKSPDRISEYSSPPSYEPFEYETSLLSDFTPPSLVAQSPTRPPSPRPTGPITRRPKPTLRLETIPASPPRTPSPRRAPVWTPNTPRRVLDIRSSSISPRAPKKPHRPRRLVKEINETNFLDESPIKHLPPNGTVYDIEDISQPVQQFVSPLHSPRALTRKLKLDVERSDTKSSPEAAGLPLTTPKKSPSPHRSSQIREPWARQYLATNVDRIPPRYTEYIPDIQEESIPYISDISGASSDLLVGTPRFSLSNLQMSKESSQISRESASPRRSPKFKEPWAQQYISTSVNRTPPKYTEYLSNIDEESLPNMSDVSLSSDRLPDSPRTAQKTVQRTEITYQAPSSSESLISENEYESRMRQLDELLSRTELYERATPSPQFNIREPFEGQEDEYFLDTSPINTDWADDERDFQWL